MVCVCVCVCVCVSVCMYFWTWECMCLFKLVFFSSLDKYPKIEWLNHMAVLVSIFFRNLHTAFHSGCTSLHSYQQCIRVPYLCILGSTCYCLFENRHYDVCEIIYLIILLICIFLISYNEHLFRCLLAICMSSLEKHLFI